MWVTFSYNNTIEGKNILLCKTFGMSQVIYFMQSCHFNPELLADINSINTKFFWSNKRPKIKFKWARAVDRGLCAPDAFSQYEGLNLEQFFRQMDFGHSVLHCIQDYNDFLINIPSNNHTLYRTMTRLLNMVYDETTTKHSLSTEYINTILACPTHFFQTNNDDSTNFNSKKYGQRTIGRLYNEIKFPSSIFIYYNNTTLKHSDKTKKQLIFGRKLW